MPRGTFVVIGIKKIDKKLRQLEPRVQKKVVRRAMRESMKLVKNAVESEAPIDTGLMRSAVKIRALKRKRNRIGVEVHINSKVEGLKVTSAGGKPVFYPAIVEFGKKGQPPNPFIRRAFDSKGPLARSVAMIQIVRGVEREATK